MGSVKELPDLIIEHSLRFVVVDSIGAIFRRELSAYDDNGARHRVTHSRDTLVRVQKLVHSIYFARN